MKNNYRIGDFVQLKEPAKHINTRIWKMDLNIFEIQKLENGMVRLKYIEEMLPLSAIAPIPANGVDDKEIYYDPIVAASTIRSPHDPVPTHRTNYTYYLDQLRDCTWEGKPFQEMMSEQKFEYVHEIQHFLHDRYHDEGLKIQD